MKLDNRSGQTADERSPIVRLRLLDAFERLLVFGLFIHFAMSMTPRYLDLASLPYAGQILTLPALFAAAGALLLLASEAIAVSLVLIRRATLTVSTSPLDWALAFAGSATPLLVHPAAPAGAGQLAAAQAMMLAGLALQIWAKLALSRSFGVVPANRGIRTRGPYRVVRHPMYAGYSLTHFGFLLGYPSSYNAVLYVSVFLVQIARLLREEQVLGADPTYDLYRKRVPNRLIPRVF